MTTLTGQCLCGSVKYEVTSSPRMSFLCQCRHCQRITGSGHSAEFVVPEKRLSITGHLSEYEMRADDGNSVVSQFCPTCGNPVSKKTSGYPGHIFIHAATLDSPEAFKPQKVFWGSSSQPWDFVDPELEVSEYA